MTGAGGGREWQAQWPVVAVTTVGFGLAHIHLYSLGVMMAPLEQEFGWSRLEISSGLLIVSLIVSPLAPFMGMLVDRLGPRRLALVGMLLYGTSVALLALAQPPLWTWWTLWTLVAFGHLFLNPTIWVTAVSSLFVASRGLALAVSMCATGLMAFAGPLVTYALIASFGWRLAYVIWGGAAILIVLPLIYLFFASSLDQKRMASTANSSTTVAPLRSEIRRALLSRPFLKLAAVALIMSNASMAVLVNMVPILMSFRMNLETAAFVAGLMGVSQIAGRLGGGFMLDRFDARKVAAVVVMLPVLTSITLLLSGHHVAAAIIAVLIFGLSIGAEMDIIAYLTARFFDIAIFGTVFGVIVGLLLMGTGVGPLIGNFIFDLTGAYTVVLMATIPLSLASAALILSLGHYPASTTPGLSGRSVS